MKSIKIKLIISFALLVLISTLSIGLTALLQSKNSLRLSAEASLSDLAREGSKLVESRTLQLERTLEILVLNETVKGMNLTEQIPYLKNILPSTDFLDLAIVDLNGIANDTSGVTVELGDRPYIQKALAGESCISDVIINKVSGEPIIMVATPIKQNGTIVGALIGKKDGNALSEITNDTGYGKDGYGYIINGKGTVIAHRDKDKVLNQYSPIEEAKNDNSITVLANVFTKALQEKNGVESYAFNGNEYYVGYAPIGGTDWLFFITANQDEVLKEYSSLKGILTSIILFVLLVSLVVTYTTGVSITKPIIETIKHAGKMADLNFADNVNQKYSKRKDEIGGLSRALQSITESLRDIITEINSFSEQVAASSEELMTTSQQSATASEEVALVIAEITKGAAEQANSTEEGANKAELLGQSIENDQAYLKKLNQATEKVSEVLKAGFSEIEHLTQKTEESNSASREIHEVILRTNVSSDKIGQASNVIASIAEETNLLALNAAIEAARAGEAGKGFAVVAEEIRKLAEQSAISTNDINRVVQELQHNSKNAVKTIEMMNEIIAKQTDSVKNSKNSFMDIAQAIKAAEQSVEMINLTGQQMEDKKNEILDTIQNLSAIAEENSASTQQVMASIEEQSATVGEIANSSEKLSMLAEKLQIIIKKFIV